MAEHQSKAGSTLPAWPFTCCSSGLIRWENNWRITALKLAWSLVLVHISGPKLPICELLQAEAVPVGNKQIADHGRAVFWGLERMPGLL